MPMIVIEDSTTFEIRDCYLRSIRKDTPTSKSVPESLEEANALAKSSMDCEEIGVLVNPRAWNLGV